MFTNLGYQSITYDHIVIFMKLFSDFRIHRENSDDYIRVPIAFEDKDNHYKSKNHTQKSSKIERTLPIFVVTFDGLKLANDQGNLNKSRICKGVEISQPKRYDMKLVLSVVTQQTTDMLYIIEALASVFRPFVNATLEYEINGRKFTKNSEIMIADDYSISYNKLKSFSDISTKLCTMDLNFTMPMYIFKNSRNVANANLIKSVTINLEGGESFNYKVEPKTANKHEPHQIVYNEKI